MTASSVSDYIFNAQANGRYSLTLDELRENVDSSPKAILQKLHRLKSKNELAQVRKTFYVILPPRYAAQGMLPSSMFIDDMMEHLERPYYLGLYSAAALHGAAHQQPMETQVMIQKPAMRLIEKKNQRIRFFVKNSWNSEWITTRKTETGTVKLSNPALTAYDLVRYHKKIGGLNRVFEILEELTESISISDLKHVASQSPLPGLQRQGYLFEHMGANKHAIALEKVLQKNNPSFLPLSLLHPVEAGEQNEKWHLMVNTKIA